MQRVVKNLVIAGKPGVGKTSLIKEITFPYRERLGGFYTEQILKNGQRLGFKIITFDRQEAVLASKEMYSETRINKYGVDLPALERVGVQAIKHARESGGVIVIDEIGAMEVLSDPFQKEVLACLTGGSPVLATIRQGAHAFTDSVKRLSDTKLLELTRAQYHETRREVEEWLKSRL